MCPIYKCTFIFQVGRLEAYGIFVKIPGFKKNGNGLTLKPNLSPTLRISFSPILLLLCHAAGTWSHGTLPHDLQCAV